MGEWCRLVSECLHVEDVYRSVVWVCVHVCYW